jgi:hypothetical protein
MGGRNILRPKRKLRACINKKNSRGYDDSIPNNELVICNLHCVVV